MKISIVYLYFHISVILYFTRIFSSFFSPNRICAFHREPSRYELHKHKIVAKTLKVHTTTYTDDVNSFCLTFKEGLREMLRSASLQLVFG